MIRKFITASVLSLVSVTAADAGWRNRCVNCVPGDVRPVYGIAVTPSPVAVAAEPVTLKPYLVPHWQCAILPCRRGWVYRLHYLPTAPQPKNE